MATDASFMALAYQSPVAGTLRVDSKTPVIDIEELSLSPIEKLLENFSVAPAAQEFPSRLVYDAAFVTQDFDLLRFEAAAFKQLPIDDARHSRLIVADGENTSDQLYTLSSQQPRPTTTATPTSTLLISSPYNNPGHYLNLITLTLPAFFFSLALTALKPTRPDYATAPYTTALNFPTVIRMLRHLCDLAQFTFPHTSFYVVVFRSTLRASIDMDYLYKLDYESHREACESGGLLKYWFGKANDERKNLATCFWHSRADAYQGGLGPWHRKARVAGRELYEGITFSTHRFTVAEGAEGWEFEKWMEQDKGNEV